LFSNPAFVKEASKRYGIILDELEDAKAHLRQAKRTAMAQPFMVGLETYVERLKYVVKMWDSTPFGRKALQQAEERAEKFIEKNKYGLYRGEVLLDIGTAHLVSFFDVDNGEKWLTRTAEWFDNVQQFDKDLKDFELPESVRKVSQPPKEERYKDRWNNVKLSQPQSGQFFNRRNCSWYWNSKRKDVMIYLGLVAYAKNDFEKAKKVWLELYNIDPFFKNADMTGTGSIPQRLIWNIDKNKGALYATYNEMAIFTDTRVRLAVLIADICLETINLREAERRFQWILENRLFSLNRNQKAYCLFALSVAYIGQFKTEKGIAILEQFLPGRPFDGTLTTSRALLHLAVNYQNIENHPERFEKKIMLYKYIVKQFPQTTEGDCAMFYIAEPYYFSGNYEKAIVYLTLYLKHYPNGVFSKTATIYLADTKKKMGTVN
jgi:tetratricopeptide (TPR) repeat protein